MTSRINQRDGEFEARFVRLLTTSVVLKTVTTAPRHITRPAGSVEYARFTSRGGLCCWQRANDLLQQLRRQRRSYMDDFINKTGLGLECFLLAMGSVTKNELVLRDGCIDERIIRNTFASYVAESGWYKLTQDLVRSTWRETPGFARP